MAVTDSTTDRILLDLPGAKGKVEVTGALGIVAKVEVDGERAKPQRGGWSIPLKSGAEGGRLLIKGYLPGFQRLMWRDDVVLQLGAHVRKPEKIMMFFPFLLIFAVVFLAPISLALFLMTIPVVKNPNMPRALKLVLPVINTFAAFFGLFAILTLISN
jgi:hypothetical protein